MPENINAYAYGLPCVIVRYVEPVSAERVFRLNLSAGYTLPGAIVEVSLFENIHRTRVPLSAISYTAPVEGV